MVINMEKLPLIVICGPTASGKTALAIKAAQLSGGEVVNADSMQIYQYMDIGTAKPTEEELAAAKHHLVGFVDPREPFSVADYVPLAHRTIREIIERGKMPILAGGTGLYINSVVNDVTFGEEGTNPEIRAELNALAAEKGAEYLLEMLAKIDPEAAAGMHPNNLRRIVRAIEFYRATGKPISVHQRETQQIESRYEPLMLMPNYERSVLYDRINRRVDIMFDSGLEDEVQKLLAMGCTKEMQSMQGIGYKETAEYLDGAMTREECKELIKMSSRRYAKRQLTWFRRDQRIHLIAPGAPIDEEIKNYFQKFKKN